MTTWEPKVGDRVIDIDDDECEVLSIDGELVELLCHRRDTSSFTYSSDIRHLRPLPRRATSVQHLVRTMGPGTDEQRQDFLNSFGEDGWALVAVADGRAYFRRDA